MARGPDLAHLISQGGGLLVIDQRGYAVVEHRSVFLLAAGDEGAAASLLGTALVVAAGEAGTEEVTVGRMTSNQQWAVGIMSDAGLAFRPWARS
ncbi:MAG: hypothetical protein M3Y91_05165 [Actinomycetota bacterium]|nr:hypothetical protein [Actinomycetota bacterium]